MGLALLVVFSFSKDVPLLRRPVAPPCPVQKLLNGLAIEVREPGLAELSPLIADAIVAAKLPHGAGLD